MLNGFSNALYGQDFFNGWMLQAASGFAGGAYSGYQMAKQMGLNPLTGGLNQEQKQLWAAYKNGDISLEDLFITSHGKYYVDAGSPEVTLGNSGRSRGSFMPLDENGKELGIVAASRDYTSVGGRVTMNPAGMTSGRRFLFTSYHELTHATMFYNGDMHNYYRFLEMNYNVGIKTSLPRQAYYQAGLKSFTERWAYGAQWARWKINGGRINYVGATWQQMLQLSPTFEDMQSLERLFNSF